MRIPAHRLTAAAVLFFCGTTAFALGLGNIDVHSALGQPLRASIGLLGADSGELPGSCIKVRVESLDGVSLATPQLAITRTGPSSSITLTSRQTINEPVATIVVEVGCAAPVRRSYQVLFDLPVFSASASPEPAPSRENRAVHASAVQPEPAEAVARAASPARFKNRQAPESAKPASPRLAASKNPASSKSAAVDVLKLSGDDDGAVSRLMLSRALSLPAAVQPLSEEMRLAQREFAALMRGEDPRAGIDAQASAAQAASLRTQMTALQRQNSANQIALAALQSGSSLVFWLSGLLILCLFAIAWLVWRWRSLVRSDEAAWWKSSRFEHENAAEFDADEPVIHRHPLSSAPQPSAESLRQPGDAGFSAASEVAPAPQNALDAGAGLALPEDAGSVHDFVPAPDQSTIAGSGNQHGRSNEFKVEEISDVTQEAEFWISLNNPKRAIEILEPYTESTHPDSPVPWLYLLDLFREVRNEEKYNALRERFTRLFNARIPLYGEPELQSQCLEDFPHLLQRICTLWGSSDIFPFLDSLLVDDRDGARAGFDLPLYRDILLLLGIAHENKRLAQLESASSGMRGIDSRASAEESPAIAAHGALPVPEDEIDFEPLEFNFESESDQKLLK